MENFEELIKDYVDKIVDKDNDGIFNYRIKRHPRRQVYNLKTKTIISPNMKDPRTKETREYTCPPNCFKYNPTKSLSYKVKTPDGIFDSKKDACEFYNMSMPAFHWHLIHYTDKEFYYYVE